MGKVALVTPLYVSVAWILLVSYQLFTQTAVSTVVSYISVVLPEIGWWMSYRIDMLVFVHAFAWIFLLSSAIPSVLLGKQRSVLIQFVVCLTLTFLAFIIQDLLKVYEIEPISQLLGLYFLFQNPIFATLYLSTPYIFMLLLDIGLRKKRREDTEFEKIKTIYKEQVLAQQDKNSTNNQ
ncbi:MAG: hypothetical protein QHH17_02940 [Candidatus Bathyarchaeota archaeon]|jgi:hypothetical protein|nr:hypothetical protein [Candidatus Bathyarchaeota archaeon]